MIFKQIFTSTSPGIVDGLLHAKEPSALNPFVTKKELEGGGDELHFIVVLNQPGTQDPVVTYQIQDDFKIGEYEFKRIGPGVYDLLTTEDTFVIGKTDVYLQNVVSGTVISSYVVTPKQVRFETYFVTLNNLNDGAITGNVMRITLFK